ncbi:putative 26S proteasome regulatory subunit [Thecaphora frezii]
MSLLELSKRVDEELQFHQATLSANGVGLKSSLIDANGFPLPDKDLVAIRSARNRIAMLHSDSRAVRERVSKLLELAINGDPTDAATARTTTASERNTSGSIPALSTTATTASLQPFARINSVAVGSPAEAAGLRSQDLVLRFSSIDYRNSDGLKALARPGVVVDGVALEVVVQRGGSAPLQTQDATTLRLVPASGWGGRGLLGCHIVPL